MASFDYDVVIIGSGFGGSVAADLSAHLVFSVATVAAFCVLARKESL